MTLTVTPSLDTLYTKLGDFIATVLSVPVIQLPVNRVAMPPPSPGFVGMRIRLDDRIMTNLDRWDSSDPNVTEIQIEQAVRIAAQLDCYSASASEWAAILSTVFRDEYAIGPLSPELSPLYADSPRNAPLVDGEEEYENRWIVEAVLQYNPVVIVPAQFANAAEIALINVDERYPP